MANSRAGPIEAKSSVSSDSDKSPDMSGQIVSIPTVINDILKRRYISSYLKLRQGFLYSTSGSSLEQEEGIPAFGNINIDSSK